MCLYEHASARSFVSLNAWIDDALSHSYQIELTEYKKLLTAISFKARIYWTQFIQSKLIHGLDVGIAYSILKPTQSYFLRNFTFYCGISYRTAQKERKKYIIFFINIIFCMIYCVFLLYRIRYTICYSCEFN